jgi:RND family efflux transporter MFP subunit
MKRPALQTRTLALLAVVIPLLALFVYVALRSGPLAPVPVTVATVTNQALSPALFGIGTVEARYTYKIGPTMAGRLKGLDVHVGDRVTAGQVLGAMDPVDLNDRIRGQEAAGKRAAAQLAEARARHDHAVTQARRYAQLLAARATSEETAATREHERQVAEAALNASREELARSRAEHQALLAQRDNLQLAAPVDGLVVARLAEPGTTMVAGQSVVEIIDPHSIWIHGRFDQIHAQGLTGGLPARIVLRSQGGRPLSGRVLRLEPLADAVTEEMLAKVVFDQLPNPLPPLGELAEVTIDLPPLAKGPVIPNAALQRRDNGLGVWLLTNGELRFTPVTLGGADLDGLVQVRDGLKAGDRIIEYSAQALGESSRITVKAELKGAHP